MSNDRHDNDDAGTPKKPSHRALHLREGNDGKTYSSRIGVAFEHRDQEGFNIMLDAVPVDGKITLRTLKERMEEARTRNSAQRRPDRSEYER